MRRHAFHAFAAACVFGAAVFAQTPATSEEQGQPSREQPPVVFKVEINYVEVDATVTDAQGNFVRTLTKNDFRILEDGKPQELSTFALVDIPVERADRPLFAAQPIEPDVRSNENEFNGRLYVMVLDDLHTQALRSPLVKAAARRFIERNLGANDLAAVVYTSGRSDVSQDLTGSRSLLLASIDSFMGRKTRSASLEKLDAYFWNQNAGRPDDPINDPLDMERGYQARMTLESVRKISEWMGGIRGRRKVLLFISEGIDYDIYDIFNARYASTVLDEARDAVAAATRANVNIYSIDPRALTSLADETIDVASLPDDASIGLGTTSFNQELRLSQDSLRVLADETGGFASVNTNDFAQAFDRIVRENSSYYVLGYYPANERRDGKFRKIEVRLNDRPGLQVRSRRGYVAPRGRAPETPAGETANGMSVELRDALNGPLQLSGLTLSANAAVFKGAAPNNSVAIALQASSRNFKFTERDGLYTDTVEVSFIAVDAQGKLRAGERQLFELKLKPATYKTVTTSGLRITHRLELPPGRYQLRAAARESGAGVIGSVHYDLEVPDFSRAPISMSGLVLTSTRAGVAPTLKPDPQLNDVLPGPPTTERSFAAGDTIALFVEAYDNSGPVRHKVDFTTTLRSDEGNVVFKTEDVRDSSELQGARGGYGHSATVPLKDVAPGLYVLKVEVRTRLGEQPAAWREVRIRVVAGR